MKSPFRPGDVVFVRGRDWLSRTLISCMSWLSSRRGGDGSAHFSHVGIMTSPVAMLETTETITRDNRDLWHLYRDNEIKVVRLPGLDAAAGIASPLVQDQIGEPYPWTSLLKYLGTGRGTPSKRMVCSELVAHAIIAGGYLLKSGWIDTDELHDTLVSGPHELVFFGKLSAHWPYGWDGPFIPFPGGAQ